MRGRAYLLAGVLAGTGAGAVWPDAGCAGGRCTCCIVGTVRPLCKSSVLPPEFRGLLSFIAQATLLV